MFTVDSPHPPGVVGITSGDLTRYTEFVGSLENMLIPKETRRLWERGYDVALNRNTIVRHALSEKLFEWVWLTDDDHIWEGDLLMRLLDRQVDVVAPLVAMRYPPFRPVSADPTAPQELKTETPFRSWHAVQLQGLQESAVIGAAGLLVRRAVLEKVGDPWFWPGQMKPGQMQEDVFFSWKVREAGFTIYIDCDNRMGHLTPCSVWPAPPDGVDIRFDFARTNIHVNLDAQEKWVR